MVWTVVVVLLTGCVCVSVCLLCPKCKVIEVVEDMPRISRVMILIHYGKYGSNPVYLSTKGINLKKCNVLILTSLRSVFWEILGPGKMSFVSLADNGRMAPKSRYESRAGDIAGRLDENKSCDAAGNHVRTAIVGGFFRS